MPLNYYLPHISVMPNRRNPTNMARPPFNTPI